jgi:hypothetical protein
VIILKKKISLIIPIVFLVIFVGCSAHIHTIGDGAQGNDELEKRQWYILFGLVPLNEVDTNEMSGGVENYEIKTEQTALDVVMNIFTSAISVYSRTVTVSK